TSRRVASESYSASCVIRIGTFASSPCSQEFSDAVRARIARGSDVAALQHPPGDFLHHFRRVVRALQDLLPDLRHALRAEFPTRLGRALELRRQRTSRVGDLHLIAAGGVRGLCDGLPARGLRLSTLDAPARG